MFVTTEFVNDFQRPRKNTWQVVQEDSTRKIRLTLKDGGNDYNISADLASGDSWIGAVAYRKADGLGGIYDTLPAQEYLETATYSAGDYATHDGTVYHALVDIDTPEAWTAAHWAIGGVAAVTLVSGTINQFDVVLIGQCFTAPGWAKINIVFYNADMSKIIHTFAIDTNVQANAESNCVSESYSQVNSLSDVQRLIDELNARIDELVDSTLSIPGKAADAKATGDAIAAMSGSGITSEAKTKLISVLQHAIYDNDQTAEILALEALLFSGSTVTITMYLTDVTSSNTQTTIQTGAAYTTTLTPTPTYSFTSVVVLMSGQDITSLVFDASTGVVSIEAVSGDISITAVAELTNILHDWDFTSSLVDSVGGVTAVTTGTQSANGISITANNQYIGLLPSTNMIDKTVEVSVSPMSTFVAGQSYHSRVIAFAKNTYRTDTNSGGFMWNKGTKKWEFYLGSAWDSNYIADADGTYLTGKTIRVYVDSNRIGHVKVSSDGITFTNVLTSAGAITKYEGLVVGGSSSDYLVGLIVTGVKVYDGEA